MEQFQYDQLVKCKVDGRIGFYRGIFDDGPVNLGLVAIRLQTGFWSDDMSCFVSMLLVHASNLEGVY